MVHYRLVITLYDGSTKVSSVKFDDVESAEYHAQLLSKSAGIEEVTIIECREYLTLHNTRSEDLLSALLG